MSETEHKTGKLKPCEMRGTIEETCKAILAENGFNDLSYYRSYQEQLEDEFYRKYYVSENCVYEVYSEDKNQDDDIFNASKNADGTINFEIKYYNGGCSFNEALGEAMKTI